MTTQTPPDRLRQDARLIRQTLLQLASSRLIVRGAVIAIAIILWLLVCRWLLSFGTTIHYDGLAALGAQTVEVLQRVNPYLWWVAVAVVTLVFFFAIKAWYQSDVASLRARTVPADTLANIAPKLSSDSLDVVRWLWRDRGEPLTIGDLREVAREIRTGRVAKMYAARAQAAALEHPASASSSTPRVTEPSLSRQDVTSRGIEPRLGA